MTAFSLGAIWEETIAFLRREGSLLIPVALATFGISQLLLEIALGGKPLTPAALQTPQALAMIPAVVLMLVGNLAVSRIALIPGRSIGESLLDTLRATPKALAAMLLLFAITAGIVLLIVIVATLGAMTFRVDPRTVTPNIVLLLSVPMMIVGVRLLLLFPVLAVEKLGATALLRRTWALSHQNFLRFLGVFAIVLMFSIIVGLIQLFVVGSIFQVLALAVSDGPLVTTLQAVVNAALEAMLSMGITLYIALIYRKIAAG